MKKPKAKSADLSLEMLKELPGVAYLCDNDGLYTMRFLSPTLREVVGYAPGDFIANKKHFAASVVLPEDLDVVDEFAELVAHTDATVGARYRLVRSNGEVFPALVFARAVRSKAGGKVKGFSGFLADISTMPALQGKPQVVSRKGGAKARP